MQSEKDIQGRREKYKLGDTKRDRKKIGNRLIQRQIKSERKTGQDRKKENGKS